jgi:hypothetical protein
MHKEHSQPNLAVRVLRGREACESLCSSLLMKLKSMPCENRSALSPRSYKTNIPMAAANIAIVVITTTTRDSIELG